MNGLIVDLFAGGGGASLGIEMGLDRQVNITNGLGLFTTPELGKIQEVYRSIGAVKTRIDQLKVRRGMSGND